MIDQVPTDLACMGCGYNLRTLNLATACPECGRAVGDSAATRLVRSDPGWLEQVHRAARTLAWTPLIGAAAVVLAITVDALANLRGATVIVGALAAVILPNITLSASYRFTALEPSASTQSRTLVTSLMPVCLIVLLTTLGLVLLGAATDASWLIVISVGVASVLPLVWWALLAAHAVRLAESGADTSTRSVAQTTLVVGLVVAGLHTATSVTFAVAGIDSPPALTPSPAALGFTAAAAAYAAYFLTMLATTSVLVFQVARLIKRSRVAARALRHGADEAASGPDRCAR